MQRRMPSKAAIDSFNFDRDMVIKAYNLTMPGGFYFNPLPGALHAKYYPHFVDVTCYLRTFRKERPKSMLQLATDYFRAFFHFHLNKHKGGYRVTQISSKYSKQLFEDFVYSRANYFNDAWRKETNRLIATAQMQAPAPVSIGVTRTDHNTIEITYTG